MDEIIFACGQTFLQEDEIKWDLLHKDEYILQMSKNVKRTKIFAHGQNISKNAIINPKL